MAIAEMKSDYRSIIEDIYDAMVNKNGNDWLEIMLVEERIDCLSEMLKELKHNKESSFIIFIHLVSMLLRTHSFNSLTSLLTGLERSEIRLDGNIASGDTLIDALKDCNGQRPGSAALLPFLDLCYNYGDSLRQIRLRYELSNIGEVAWTI